eukprot:5699601-Pyramimonas_sp.AAC.1
MALHYMPWHGTSKYDASAAAGTRFGTSGRAEMKPTLQRDHDSEQAEARKCGHRCSGSNTLKQQITENPIPGIPS